MIKKIGTIKHFAVFENYNWDLSSTDKNGQPLKFEKINISMTPRLSYNCILNMLKDMKMQKQYLTKDYQSTIRHCKS